MGFIQRYLGRSNIMQKRLNPRFRKTAVTAILSSWCLSSLCLAAQTAVPPPVVTWVNDQATWPANNQTAPSDISPQDKTTKLLVLGSGTPMPNPYRFGPASAVIVNGYPYFVDCGEGWFRAVNRAAVNQHGIDLTQVFALGNLKYMFLTHLHEDHTVGLPSFILGPYKYASSTDKVIMGPPGTDHLVNGIVEAWSADRQEQFEGMHGSPQGSGANAGDIDPDHDLPGPVFEDANVTVQAFKTEHGAFASPLAYRFTAKSDGRVIAVGGDGHYSPGLVQAAKNADVLVIEGVTWDNLKFANWGGGNLDEKIKNISRYHMFPADLKRVQDESHVKEIVMVHEQNFAAPGKYDPLGLQHEMEKNGVKNIHSAVDGDLF
jgi:ribonuclease Z